MHNSAMYTQTVSSYTQPLRMLLTPAHTARAHTHAHASAPVPRRPPSARRSPGRDSPARRQSSLLPSSFSDTHSRAVRARVDEQHSRLGVCTLHCQVQRCVPWSRISLRKDIRVRGRSTHAVARVESWLLFASILWRTQEEVHEAGRACCRSAVPKET
jgi:hypothetical protein